MDDIGYEFQFNSDSAFDVTALALGPVIVVLWLGLAFSHALWFRHKFSMHYLQVTLPLLGVLWFSWISYFCELCGGWGHGDGVGWGGGEGERERETKEKKEKKEKKEEKKKNKLQQKWPSSNSNKNKSKERQRETSTRANARAAKTHQ